MLKWIFMSLFASMTAFAVEQQQDSDLIYGQGKIEINTQVNAFENIAPNKPIQASVMITHPASSAVDISSFRIGGKALNVTFVSTAQMSPYSNIAVSIYNFQVDGMPQGSHVIPEIKVKVAGKEYTSLPLPIDIGG